MQKLKQKHYEDNFNKQAGAYLYDNNSDEIVLNALNLYPNKPSHFFAGPNGQVKKKAMAEHIRKTFNAAVEGDTYMGANGKLKRKLGAGLQKVGRSILTASLAPARGSALALIRLNFRGLARRYDMLNAAGLEKVKNKWKKLGGNADKLQAAIDAGKGKPMFVCGKKCRSKAGPNPQSTQSDFANIAGVDDAAFATMVAAGGGVIVAITKVVGDKKNYKNEKDLIQFQSELAQKDREEKAIDATMTPSEQKIADEIIKAQESGSDPAEAIRKNPNLTAEEKAEALKQLGEAEGFGINLPMGAKIFFGGLLLVGGIWAIYKYTE
jgi:hypothetical protein